jgi:hypothetical protein
VRTWSDDKGSLPMAMLLTLVGVALSSLMVPVVLTQTGSTREQVERVHALHAAQAGLDVAVAHIRAANDGAGVGVLAKLPCGPFSGKVGLGGTARYQVTIDYLATDPRGQSDSWVTANRITCTAGAGASSLPAFALLRSQGTDHPTGTFVPTATRSLRGTYVFHTSNPHITGGLIHVWKTSTDIDLCLDAGSGSPAAGTNLQIQRCDPTSNRQKFAYNPNLTLVLVSSKTTTNPLGMCLDAGTPHVAGAVVKFQPCSAVTRPQQQWSYNDYGNFEGTTDGTTLDGFCFNVDSASAGGQSNNSQNVGNFIILGRVGNQKCRRSYDNIQNFFPDPPVGAGAAGAAVGQVVNYAQFGRCMDVTHSDVNHRYLIVWPCMQAPHTANIGWSQKFSLPAVPVGGISATGRITTSPGTLYCLRSPGSTAAGQYVTVAPCPSGSTPLNMTWTVYADTGVYETSYRIQDAYGYCLSPTDPTATPPDLYSEFPAISKIVVAPCTGSTMQKWNAPPGISNAQPLKDIGEK